MAPPETILYCEGQEECAKALAASLGLPPPLCAMQLATAATPHLVWERFPSMDPNIKVLAEAVHDKHVVLLMSQDGTVDLCEQVQVLLFLQRFLLPDALEDQAKDKWKRTVRDGKFTVASAASISVVLPWYRYCQMERTSRWTVREGKWYNGQADGAYVDVPTALTFASILSAAPAEGPPPSGACPKRLLLVDMHEYEDLERVLDASGAWCNTRQPYDFVHGTGTYFASAFDDFLKRMLSKTLAAHAGGIANAFVVFPDHGAHRRFYLMVHTALPGIALDRICWIDKSRVGAEVSQAERLSYLDEEATVVVREGQLPAGSYVLIADDFTNSGSTLFGGAKIIRKLSGGPVTVAAYVSHFLAKYDQKTVAGFASKLYGDDGGDAALDYFYTTDSIPRVIGWLDAELSTRATRKAEVMPLAPLISSWLSEAPATLSAPSPASVHRATQWLSKQMDGDQLSQFQDALSSAVNAAITKPAETTLAERLETVATALSEMAKRQKTTGA